LAAKDFLGSVRDCQTPGLNHSAELILVSIALSQAPAYLETRKTRWLHPLQPGIRAIMRSLCRLPARNLLTKRSRAELTGRIFQTR